MEKSMYASVYGTKKKDKIKYKAAYTKKLKKNGELLVDALAGNDKIDFKTCKFALRIESGKDDIYGGKKSDNIDSGAGNNKIYGYNGSDTINGGSGNDKIWDENGNDTVYGGTDSDIIYCDSGYNYILGTKVIIIFS